MMWRRETYIVYETYSVCDVKNQSAKNKFSVISCFAGGGGSSTGYRLAGGNVLLINEFVEEAIQTYTNNFPDTPVLIDDIRKYSAKDFLDKAGIVMGELDILDGSPPCSAFSVAGKREKGWGKEKSYSDNKTQVAIEDLFYEFIRIAEGVQPRVIIAENVKGITFGEARKKLNAFCNAFENIGYDVTYKVMNSADFGVPQARERTIFICVREDITQKAGLNFLTLNSILPKPTYTKHVSIREAIDDIENDPEEIDMLRNYLQGSFQKKFVENLPFYPKRHSKPSDKEHRLWNPKGSCFNMIRPCPDLPSPTLTQQGQKLGLSGVFHYADNRKLTIKEMKRIMGLPEDFILTGTFDQQAERIGRMVAPIMMQHIAMSINENILEKVR